MLSRRRAFFAIALAALAESSLSFLFPMSFAFPHLGLVVLTFAALEDGAAAGFRFGLWLGFLIDVMSVERFGFSMALYGAVGAACGALRGKVFAESFISQWLIPSAAYLTAIFTASVFFPAYDDVGTLTGFFDAIRGSSFAATAIASPVIYFCCEKTLRSKKARASGSFL